MRSADISRPCLPLLPVQADTRSGAPCFSPAACLQGVAINFVKNDDIKILRDIEQYYSTQVRGACGATAATACLPCLEQDGHPGCLVGQPRWGKRLSCAPALSCCLWPCVACVPTNPPLPRHLSLHFFRIEQVDEMPMSE